MYPHTLSGSAEVPEVFHGGEIGEFWGSRKLRISISISGMMKFDSIKLRDAERIPYARVIFSGL